MIRTVSAVLIAAGLVIGVPPAVAAGEPPTDANQAAQEAANKAIQEAMRQAASAQPAAIPVPSDLPVVKKTELADGLVAEDLKLGDGYEVKEGGAVVAHYHGTLKEGGKVFDSSFTRGEPASFPLSGVIPGWQKGVPGMKIGGIRRLLIPAALAYGERGAGAEIPPNSDLVFIIQLVDALQIEEISEGDGEVVGPRPVCVTAYSMKDADGKEFETASKDKPFIWVPGEHMGVSMGMEGMKVGGKRKIIIPKEMNQTAPGAPTGRPSDVQITVELELLAVKNLIPPTPKP